MTAETRGFPSGQLRASDADRDLAIAELSEHFQTGRLSQEEFDDRSARALQAKTGQELTELFADLPGPPGWPGRDARPAAAQDGSWGFPDPAASPGEPWSGPAWTGPSSSWPSRDQLGRSPSGQRPVPFVIVGVLAVIVVASLAGSAVNVGVVHIGIGHGGLGWLIPVLLVVFVLRRIARRR